MSLAIAFARYGVLEIFGLYCIQVKFGCQYFRNIDSSFAALQFHVYDCFDWTGFFVIHPYPLFLTSSITDILSITERRIPHTDTTNMITAFLILNNQALWSCERPRNSSWDLHHCLRMNISRPKQNGRNSAGDISKHIVIEFCGWKSNW